MVHRVRASAPFGRWMLPITALARHFIRRDVVNLAGQAGRAITGLDLVAVNVSHVIAAMLRAIRRRAEHGHHVCKAVVNTSGRNADAGFGFGPFPASPPDLPAPAGRPGKNL